MGRVYFAVLVLFLIAGCTSVVNQTPTLPTKGVPYPVQPGVRYPVQPGVPYPVQPGVPYPVQPGVPYPVQPGVPYPVQPGVPYPVQPGVSYPMQPGVPYVVLPGVFYAVLPFENYTETPYAGYRVASIVEGVLASKGYILIPRVWSIKEREPTEEEIEKLKESAVRNGARYIVHGSVNEFRYKTGLDGEPAISITIFIYDAIENRVVRNVTVSGSGWVRESLGTLAQKLLNRAF